jgi:hypothetical protein
VAVQWMSNSLSLNMQMFVQVTSLRRLLIIRSSFDICALLSSILFVLDPTHPIIGSLKSQDHEAIQPQPPTTLNFRGRTYFLQTSLSVRKVTETPQLSTGAGENMKQSVSARVITESVLDLESNQKFTTCQVCDHEIWVYGGLIHELGYS